MSDDPVISAATTAQGAAARVISDLGPWLLGAALVGLAAVGVSRSPSPPDETGGLGERTDQLNRCQSGRTFSACGPFWPCTISNSTRWFSSSER